MKKKTRKAILAGLVIFMLFIGWPPSPLVEGRRVPPPPLYETSGFIPFMPDAPEQLSFPPLTSTPSPTAQRTLHPTYRPFGISVSGYATWYCKAERSRCSRNHPDGPEPDFYAAAGPALRSGWAWRGEYVNVCTVTRREPACVIVQLIDWCACRDRNGRPTVLDLYWDAMDALGGSGILRVTVFRP